MYSTYEIRWNDILSPWSADQLIFGTFKNIADGEILLALKNVLNELHQRYLGYVENVERPFEIA